MRVDAARLVGRRAELDALEDALLEASRGEGQLVLLAGEAGIGKSRLADEARDQAIRLGWLVLAGSCSEAELSVPYLPVVEAVGNFLADADLAELDSRLGGLGRELAQLFPQLHAEP
ncbi:MAG TPA: AAA family ATPase, partial [Acidimicrobiales bacterium]|nr:AAA family ATPase [Acidimicrobiales bacterium]